MYNPFSACNVSGRFQHVSQRQVSLNCFPMSPSCPNSGGCKQPEQDSQQTLAYAMVSLYQCQGMGLAMLCLMASWECTVVATAFEVLTTPATVNPAAVVDQKATVRSRCC